MLIADGVPMSLTYALVFLNRPRFREPFVEEVGHVRHGMVCFKPLF